MQTWDYKDTVTYWGAPTSDGWGNKSFDAPVTLMCRWEQMAERFITYTGEETVSKAIIWVPQTVELGGYMLRGTSAAVDPTVLADAFEIQMLSEIPDLRSNFVERRAYL